MEVDFGIGVLFLVSLCLHPFCGKAGAAFRMRVVSSWGLRSMSSCSSLQCVWRLAGQVLM